MHEPRRPDLIHVAALCNLLLEKLEGLDDDDLASDSLIADLRELSEATKAKLSRDDAELDLNP
jgi:hypothetical protein